MRHHRIPVLVGIAAGLIGVSACSSSRAADPAGSRGAAVPARIAPCSRAPARGTATHGLPELTLRCLGAGPPVDVAGIAGPALVSLWASWCYPCRTEMPLLQRASGSVRIVGVDTNDRESAAKRFATRTVHATYEQLSDPDGRLAVALHAPGLPYTVAIGRSGAVVWRKAGKLTGSDVTEALHAARAGGR